METQSKSALSSIQASPKISGATSPKPAFNEDFTFGVEFEFMLLSKKERQDISRFEALGSNALAKDIVRDALSGDLQAQCKACGDLVKFRLPLRQGLLPPKEWENEYDTWEVATENFWPRKYEWVALGGVASDYAWEGVEIKSRMLHPLRCLQVQTSPNSHVHEISYEDEISAVLVQLQHRFTRFDGQEPQNDYLYATDEAGLHVHVGNQLEGLDIGTTKKVLCMSLAFERQVDSVQAIHRIGATDIGTRPLFYPTMPSSAYYTKNDPSVYNVGLADGFLYHCYDRRREAEKGNAAQLSAHPLPAIHPVLKLVTKSAPDYPASHYDDPSVRKASEGFNKDSWLTLVAQAPNIEALLGMYTTAPKNTIVNIKQLNRKMNPWKMKRTLEFRQHRSTLQAEAVISWLRFVVALVAYCESNNTAAIMALLTRDNRVRRSSFDFAELCKLIGCDDNTVRHYTDQLSGAYAHDLRHREKLYAHLAQGTAEPLAPLALFTIQKERTDITPTHVQQRLREKLLMGGYGQYSRDYIDDALGSVKVSEDERRKITLGYRAPIYADQYTSARFTACAPGPDDPGDVTGIVCSLLNTDVSDFWETAGTGVEQDRENSQSDEPPAPLESEQHRRTASSDPPWMAEVLRRTDAATNLSSLNSDDGRGRYIAKSQRQD
ncbi:uncharacterized protein LTR77_000581 [Saxophila tyrrhenica]|uniref:Uncharacterized protein n=1 Tax=Saxophila tyrrhenica TaxID=1690608 RepID=A0AAV9PNQ0_9PEZI|nr:hypothetical protein LTR77_000581 [Saxophila tyrrhenica]